ncbi:C40 family peptidase [Ralstonia insidiosa]|jgi:cell wall-associated NlpC family hydrolase|uniref:C40 family peptidase n=1 Tax=Ralstonia insidiosa TaxID=190721 RepID=A0A191ZXG8_9RALS|nr:MULTISPECIES: C40 family peptidase [Ralstonia]ANH71475.1 nlpC/P60 family protein [Ralstonia insidiosa]ANJ72756.1 peptidase P60 [Ralstonia insidiosa]EPX98422.1 peptidase P60 [Ralstonia sp. AU12-08]KAB0473314.1 NlpC/P60 family protein [Ralstonia insidiosa]MBY4704598.1 C40 family peptidase [Ralstonia insidiosa]
MQHFVLHSMARLAVGVVIGCSVIVSSAVQADTVFKDTEVRADAKPEAKPGLISNVMTKTGDVVMNALGMIGLRYRFGGNTPESGLDCSGFVRYVFNDTFGFLLPRRAVEMSRVGTSVETAELRPGDLVFFNTMRHTFSHVGIYIGDNKFVHAPSTGSKIRVDDMTASYWVSRYNGARRIEGNSGTPIKDGADNFVEQLKRVDPNAAGKPLALYGG